LVLVLDDKWNRGRRKGWDALLRVLAIHSTVEEIKLEGRSDSDPHVVEDCLRSIQQNPSIRRVHLHDLRRLEGASAICSFLDAATSLTSLSLCEIGFTLATREQSENDLGAALQRNTNITKLTLFHMSHTTFVAPIVRGLIGNTTLQVLEFVNYMSTWNCCPDIPIALRELLLDPATTSIRKVELVGPGWAPDTYSLDILRRNAKAVAEAVTHSKSMTDFKVSRRTWTAQNAPAVFQCFFQKKNLRSLQMCGNAYYPGQSFKPLRDYLQRADSPLRILEIDCDPINNLDVLGDEEIGNLLQAVSRSKLVRFLIGKLNTRHCRLCTSYVQSMKLRELVMTVLVVEENMKQDLVEAVKRNFSLLSLESNILDDDPVFRARIQFYLDRNARLEQWIQNPASVPRELWPEAMKLALDAGHGILYAFLRALAGSQSDSLQQKSGERKRKRSAAFSHAA